MVFDMGAAGPLDAGERVDASTQSVTERARRRRGRRTQAERSAEMRQRIQEATLACLAELGYAGTSFTTVADRAGVSRGAIQHHYRSKAYLIVGAIETLLTRVEAGIFASVADHPPGPARAAEVVDGLWRATVTSPIRVMTEIRVAARTDDTLQAILQPIERASRQRHEHLVAEALADATATVPDLTARFNAMIATIRGLAISHFYQGWSWQETEAAWAVAVEEFRVGLSRVIDADGGAP